MLATLITVLFVSAATTALGSIVQSHARFHSAWERLRLERSELRAKAYPLNSAQTVQAHHANVMSNVTGAYREWLGQTEINLPLQAGIRAQGAVHSNPGSRAAA
jgi:hypothetical protein